MNISFSVNRILSIFLRTISVLVLLMVFFVGDNVYADTWVMKAPMLQPRTDHTSILQPNGKILVMGGLNSFSGILNSVEEYDPVKNIWTMKAPMFQPRGRYTSILQPNGKILAIGGGTSGNSVEEYDPTKNTWTIKASMLQVRVNYTSILQPNGKILVIGGVSSTGLVNTIEEYDPVVNKWVNKMSLQQARANYTTVLESNGKILIMGGTNKGGYLNSVEEYDPVNNTSTIVKSMIQPRSYYTSILQPNGKILAIGGGSSTGVINSVEEYDPVTNTWTMKASMLKARANYTSILQPNGKILAIGGYPGGLLNSVEEFDPTRNIWTTKPSLLLQSRSLHTAVLEPNGKILIMGGYGDNNRFLNTVEELTLDSPLSLTSSTPSHSSTGVITNTLIALEFSSPLDPSTVPGNIVLEKDGLASVGMNVVSQSLNSVVFQPFAPLDKNTSYTVRLRTGLRDINGNALGAESSFSFVTEPALIPPTNLHQQIQSPLLEIQEVKPGERIGKYQSGSGIILSATNNASGSGIKLDFEVYKVWATLPSYIGSGTSKVIIPFLGDGEYLWRVRAIDETGNGSDWVDFGKVPLENDFAFYEGFEPYPHGYKFANATLDYSVLNGGIGTSFIWNQDRLNRYKIDGNRWDLFEAALQTDWTSPGGETKMFDAFEIMGLGNDGDGFNGGACYGMAVSAAMQYTHPEFLQSRFPGYSSKVGTGYVWDTLDPLSLNDLGEWDTYNDPVLQTILTFQLMQYDTNQNTKINTYTRALNAYNTIKDNPDKIYALSFQGTKTSGYFFTKNIGHTVIPYKVEAIGEWKRIYFWDNNIEYPKKTNEQKDFFAYNQYIEITSTGAWKAPFYDDWKTFDKMSLVSLDDLYNGGKKSPPIGFNGDDVVYALSGESDLFISDSSGRISGFSGGIILEGIPGVNPIVPLSETLSGATRDNWKRIYLPKKIDGLSINVVGKNQKNYDLMIAGGNFYTKVSGVSTGSGQIDVYNSTGTGLTLDFDDAKTGAYTLMTDNFQDTLIGTIFLSGITVILQPQKYTYDWTKVLQNSNDAISYQVDTDSDGIYDILSNFSAVPKEPNEKGTISGYIKGDTNATMAGWKVFIDTNNNGKLEESFEPFLVTDNKGYYKFDNLDKGNYTIIEIPHQNWVVTKPQSSKYTITLNNGQNVVNLNFENSFTKGKNK